MRRALLTLFIDNWLMTQMILPLMLSSFFILISCTSQSPHSDSGPDTAVEKIEGTIDRAEVRQAIRNHLSEIKRCYEDELKKTPNLEGKLVVRFEVTEQGLVRSAGVQKSSLNNVPVENCVTEVIKSTTFPRAPAGAVAVIDYPFVFGVDH